MRFYTVLTHHERSIRLGSALLAGLASLVLVLLALQPALAAEQLQFLETDDGVVQYEYVVLVTSLADPIATVAQHYRDRGDADRGMRRQHVRCGRDQHDREDARHHARVHVQAEIARLDPPRRVLRGARPVAHMHHAILERRGEAHASAGRGRQQRLETA